jgi:signal transduction histidine kinase
VEKNRQKDLILQQQSKQAAMGEMISAIAHQWRQPLSTIGTLAQDFEDAFTYNEMDLEYIRKNTGEMMAQIDYMSHTIEDFRNFFKPDRIKNGFNLTQTIDEVFHLLSSQLKNSAIEYSLVNRLTGPDVIYGYENELKQVLINLINNARDAIVDKMHEGGFEGMGQIRIVVENAGDAVRIGVCDNAGGIVSENIDKIFDPYFTTKPKDEGTGIGLYIARQIIEEHFGGGLSVSNDDQGANFTILLPKITRNS